MRGPKVPEYMHKVAIYVPGKPVEEVERELGVTGIVKLASNENPLGSSPRAIAAVQKALPTLNRYPDGGGYVLRRAVAERQQVDIEQVILGNGSVEIIEMLSRAYVEDGDDVVMSQQSFVSYEIAVRQVNGNAIAVPARPDRGHDLDAIAAALTPRTKLVYLANPCNPTGTYFSRAELDAFLGRVGDEVLVVLDQAYLEYVDKADYPDGLQDLKRGRNVIALRTFSKIYGLAGLRIGYGLAAPEVIADLNRVRSPFNTSSLAQVAALAALDDEEWATYSREHNLRELAYMHAELGRRGVRYTPSVCNFILIELDADIKKLFVEFQKHGVILRPQGGPGLASCARVSLGTREENDKFLRVLDHLVLGA
ncbi:MAG: histidinol-phosphate transaminase [Thermoanaerobaculaceae bacterium]